MREEIGGRKHTFIFPLAHSKLVMTPSITLLILLTLSSSLLNPASLAASASYFDSSLRCGCGSLVLVGIVLCWCLDTLDGDANSASVSSSEDEKSNLPWSGVDMLGGASMYGGLRVVLLI